MSVTWTPRSASCHAASHPARPAPITLTSCMCAPFCETSAPAASMGGSRSLCLCQNGSSSSGSLFFAVLAAVFLAVGFFAADFAAGFFAAVFFCSGGRLFAGVFFRRGLLCRLCGGLGTPPPARSRLPPALPPQPLPHGLPPQPPRRASSDNRACPQGGSSGTRGWRRMASSHPCRSA